MKKNLSTIILFIILFIGVGLLGYPTFSDYWNSFHQTRAIANYSEQVAKVDDDTYIRMLREAEVYNQKLAETGVRWTMNESEKAEYKKALDITGTGIMGYIEIQKIHCNLPIYHGTDEGILQIAIGHLEGSSLPVGGESSHCILTGHRGLPSARLFTDIDQLVEGDTFEIRTLNEVYTYEVDQIRIVLPEELDELRIVEGQDYCTLVTCTPYGVNSHRLLVRGHRIANSSRGSVLVTSDALQIDEKIVALVIGGTMLIVLLIIVLLQPKQKTNNK